MVEEGRLRPWFPELGQRVDRRAGSGPQMIRGYHMQHSQARVSWDVNSGLVSSRN
jgi:hypothetical protein